MLVPLMILPLTLGFGCQQGHGHGALIVTAAAMRVRWLAFLNVTCMAGDLCHASSDITHVFRVLKTRILLEMPKSAFNIVVFFPMLSLCHVWGPGDMPVLVPR